MSEDAVGRVRRAVEGTPFADPKQVSADVAELERRLARAKEALGLDGPTPSLSTHVEALKRRLGRGRATGWGRAASL